MITTRSRWGISSPDCFINSDTPRLRPRNNHSASTKYTTSRGRQQPSPQLPSVGHAHHPLDQLRREHPGQRPHRHPVGQPAIGGTPPAPSCATPRSCQREITRSGKQRPGVSRPTGQQPTHCDRTTSPNQVSSPVPGRVAPSGQHTMAVCRCHQTAALGPCSRRLRPLVSSEMRCLRQLPATTASRSCWSRAW